MRDRSELSLGPVERKSPDFFLSSIDRFLSAAAGAAVRHKSSLNSRAQWQPLPSISSSPRTPRPTRKACPLPSSLYGFKFLFCRGLGRNAKFSALEFVFSAPCARTRLPVETMFSYYFVSNLCSRVAHDLRISLNSMLPYFLC